MIDSCRGIYLARRWKCVCVWGMLQIFVAIVCCE